MKPVTVNNINWLTDSNNLICPVGTYRNLNYDGYCYRDAIN